MTGGAVSCLLPTSEPSSSSGRNFHISYTNSNECCTNSVFVVCLYSRANLFIISLGEISRYSEELTNGKHLQTRKPNKCNISTYSFCFTQHSYPQTHPSKDQTVNHAVSFDKLGASAICGLSLIIFPQKRRTCIFISLSGVICNHAEISVHLCNSETIDKMMHQVFFFYYSVTQFIDLRLPASRGL